MHGQKRLRSGFSLIEVMVAMAVLLFASAGALLGLISASNQLRDGQRRVYATVLVDSLAQRVRLQNKQRVLSAAAALPPPAWASMPLGPFGVAIGGAGWQIAPPASWLGNLAASAGDLSTGALFILLPNGTMTPCTGLTQPACGAATSCADTANIPAGVFCREVALSPGGPVQAPGAIVAASSSAATLWIRVSRQGDPLSQALVSREVVVQ